ncbi:MULTISPECIES: GNAT family N-acetyltransferase [unclassified Prochlorococcus]|uniref:GNAT family N-acetyltransferase n=1 Tax=unclassified Prochlorococcus TaxID=2627481 RepID=UPI000533A3C3|nr:MULTISPECIES: GNAT family N-acetyltransferase [unclassified Prochlorococcus]KGG15194.1 GCN5-related N-acetyltransferase [Prochlorococcus sp. MIT 0602]KGG17468.1 GCN5-related N-acetyltransferase [Prochlorococcus sp. MIT 0603]
MKTNFYIRPLEEIDINTVTYWARNEGFAPGLEDVNIYKNTDTQGLWIGALDSQPIGCIAGVKYNSNYGFLGLFIVDQPYRGRGYGLQLWKHVIHHLDDISCLGLEAAPNRITDYESWGFKTSSITTRWELNSAPCISALKNFSYNVDKYMLLEGNQIPPNIITNYDKNKENTPRPHFLSNWLNHKSGTVIAIVDHSGECVAFCRIRPCLLKNGIGYRIGPLVADSSLLAKLILKHLVLRYQGTILIDSPGINIKANKLFRSLGSSSISYTVRMYKGSQPSISMNEIYGLACLELG